MKLNMDSDWKVIGFFFGAGLTLVLGVFYLVGLWTDRTLDFWLTYFKGADVDCPFWLSLLVSVLLNAVILGLNIISEVARLLV
jgi:hypothetical protein